MVAIPHLAKGFTGAKAAKLMLQYAWRPFGVPSIITSDLGSHFVSGWWQTMCALMGIRQAYSQAYHHQANGRAERAGQQIMERLKKIQVEDKLNWVEALPQALDRIHDTPGESGLSPFQILFGRHRPLGGLPYEPLRDCEDSRSFFSRQREIDLVVASKMNNLHAEQCSRANRGLDGWEVLGVGDLVWYLRPPDSGTKLDSRWLGPCKVIAREGVHSYLIETKPGHIMKAHRKALKLYVEDPTAEEPIPLFFHRRTVPEAEGAPDTWLVDKIIDHKLVKGKMFFLTRWQGFDEANWEPIEHFFQEYNSDVIAYCRERGLPLDVSKDLKATST
jgi:hypothetical protein